MKGIVARGRESRFGASGALARPPEAGSDSTLLESRFQFPPYAAIRRWVMHSQQTASSHRGITHTIHTRIPGCGCVEAPAHNMRARPGANTLISAYQPPYAPWLADWVAKSLSLTFEQAARFFNFHQTRSQIFTIWVHQFDCMAERSIKSIYLSC